MPFPKIALEEHIILPSQVDYVHWPSEILEGKQSELIEHETKRLAVMKKANIEMSVLSAFSDGLQAMPSCKISKQQALTWNDELKKISDQSSGRLTCFAALPMCDPSAAEAELRRCCTTPMNFLGALINGHDTSNDQKASNRYVSKEYDRVWSAAAELAVPIYIHPRMADASSFFDEPHCAELRGSAWGFHSSTARLVLALIMNGVCDRHPNLRFILGHMGEIVVWMAWRVDHRCEMEGRPAKVVDTLRKNFYVTVSGWMDDASFMHVRSVMGSDRILYASDYPMEDTVAHAEWFDKLPISDEEKRKIAYENALALFPTAEWKARWRVEELTALQRRPQKKEQVEG